MKTRLQVWFANFLRNRIDRQLWDIPIRSIVEQAVREHVESAVADVAIEAIVRKAADQAIDDDCDVDSLVLERVNRINIADHIDYSQFAAEVDLSDLAEQIDLSLLAGSIDSDDLGVRSGPVAR